MLDIINLAPNNLENSTGSVPGILLAVLYFNKR